MAASRSGGCSEIPKGISGRRRLCVWSRRQDQTRPGHQAFSCEDLPFQVIQRGAKQDMQTEAQSGDRARKLVAARPLKPGVNRSTRAFSRAFSVSSCQGRQEVLSGRQGVLFESRPTPLASFGLAGRTETASIGGVRRAILERKGSDGNAPACSLPGLKTYSR
jgi:hypothetical protein